MQVEILELWSEEEWDKECLYGTWWGNVVKLVQAEFRDGKLVEETVTSADAFTEKIWALEKLFNQKIKLK